MADRLITDAELTRRYRAAQGSLPAPGTHPDEDLWVALTTGTADAGTRATAFDHILRCPECTRVWQGLSGLTDDAEADGLLPVTDAGAPGGWLSAPAARFAVAAALVIGVGLGAWVGSRFPGGPPIDAVRSGPGTADVFAVESVLDMQTGTEAIARRAVTLLTCAAPMLGGGERLQASLAGPSAQVAWTAEDVDPISGRVRVVVDLTEAEPGTWTLQLIRRDASGREQSSSACGFELR